MKNVLIIDDNAQIRQLIKWALTDAGYELQEASTGESGIDLAKKVKPDLVLLDVVMPGDLDGFQACAQLRALPDFADVKIVLLSAYDEDSYRQQGQQAGANAYLVKPFKPAGLRSLVDKLLEG